MLIQDRVRVIMKANNLSSAEFADRLGIKRSNLSHVLSGRNKPGIDFLSKIIEAYPNVNAAWLITGSQQNGDFEGLVREEDPPVYGRSNRSTQQDAVEPGLVDAGVEKIVFFYADGSFKTYLPNAE
jgi:transcriptional regulator with XRE-family HTH domain